MPIERCSCGSRPSGACNDCERSLCEECSSPDFRCYDCCGSNAEVASLFDDPERVSLDDDENELDSSEWDPALDWADAEFEDIEGSGY